MNKKISNKAIIIAILTIFILAVLYFLFFVVDIVNYVKNYDYLQEAGSRADELHNEIQDLSNELDSHREEHKQKMQNIY